MMSLASGQCAQALNVSKYLTFFILKTCPCNIQRFFSEAKIESFNGNFLILFLVLLNLSEAVLTSIHNLCFKQKYLQNQTFSNGIFFFFLLKKKVSVYCMGKFS